MSAGYMLIKLSILICNSSVDSEGVLEVKSHGDCVILAALCVLFRAPHGHACCGVCIQDGLLIYLPVYRF